MFYSGKHYLVLYVAFLVFHTQSIRYSDGMKQLESDDNRRKDSVNSVHSNPKRYHCLGILEDDRDYFLERLAEGDLSVAEQDKYNANLVAVNRLIDSLKHRLNGPRAEEELERYRDELRILSDENHRKYEQAKRSGDDSGCRHYRRKLSLINKELGGRTENKSPRVLIERF